MVRMRDRAWKDALARRLLSWYRRHARPLPWRASRDPYRVWVSEVMLQQTQVATVIPYYERFLAAFPSISALAAAREDDVLRLWEGLGYYRRARQLHRAAGMIEHQHAGEFPTDESAVRRLPGIGRYTAAAILSITRDERLPILEGNTQRLYARLMALRGATDDVATQSRLWSFAESILPRKHCGAFNQALMELGATICTPRSPRCDVCPVSMLCAANRRGLADRIPPPRRRPAVEQVNEALVVVRRRGKILLVRYHENGRWGRLWDFLRFPVNGSTGDAAIREIERQITAQTGLVVDRCAAVMTINHTVTRFRITLACYETDADRGRPKAKKFAEARWIAAAELSTFPLNKTARRLANQIREKS